MYNNEPVEEELKNRIYSYLEHIKEFDNLEARIQPESYGLRHYSDVSKYIFSIDYIYDSKLAALDGIVKVEGESYTVQYTSTLDRTVKADSFRIEDDKIIRKSYNLSTNTTDEKEFDKELFTSKKTYKKD